MSTDTTKQIFLVESDPDLRSRIASMLNELNYSTSSFSSMDEINKSKSKKIPHLFLSSKSQSLSKEMKQCPSIQLSADMNLEDILDSIEKAIGLPPLKNGKDEPKVASPFLGGGAGELEKEIESLQEQVAFYQRQLDQVSVVGEKESREMDQILKDLQEDLDRTKDENTSLKDELKLTKADLSKKDRELSQKETLIIQVREEIEQENKQLKAELEDLRKQSDETKEQHKKAQNALREYYRAKVDKHTHLEASVTELEEKISEIEKKCSVAEKELSTAEKKLDEKNSLIEQLESEVQTEKAKGKKAKEALAQLTKAFE